MLVYVVMIETENGDRNVLGVSEEREQALMLQGKYAAEYQGEECWVQEFDTENCVFETEEKYHMVHQTRMHKASKLTSHVIIFTKDEVPLVEEEGDWYVIRREEVSFDREAGLAKNLEVLEDYLEDQYSRFVDIIPSVFSKEDFEE